MKPKYAPKVGQTAFWPYDLFPFVLHAVVEAVPSKGCYTPKGYGGVWSTKLTEGFHRAEPSPNKIVFLDQPDGERVAKELAQLRADYDKAKSDLLEDYMARAAKVAPFLQEVSFHMYHPDGVHNQDKKKRKK